MSPPSDIAKVPARFNMARYCLEPGARRDSTKTALQVFSQATAGLPSQSWTYGEIYDQTCRIGGALAEAGLQRGERLAIRMDNCADYALAFFAAVGAGLVPIPISSQLSAPEVDFIIADSGAAAIAHTPGLPIGPGAGAIQRFSREDITAMRFSGPAAEMADTAAGDGAYLVYTSGTTSRPKGVLHAHRAAWARRAMYRDWYGIEAADTVLHAGAFNWTYTLGTGLTDPWANGATSVVYTGTKDIQVWPALIRAAQATIFAAVPTLYRQMLKYCDLTGEALGKLRHGLTAGEALPPSVAAEWRETTGLTLYEAFGMSELSTYISSSPTVPPRAGSPGRPQNGRRVAILPLDGGTSPLPAGETGIIAAHRSDPGLMLGYWNRPEEEAAMFRGGWFLTGDMGRMDEDGYVWLAGRSDDMMNAFGYRVSPFEVEAVLQAFPGVQEAAVVEREAGENVRIITAFVVWHDGQGDERALLAHAGERLAAYKVPREIVAIGALPHTANGKVRRADLRAMALPGKKN